MKSLLDVVNRLAMEPPFRILAREVVRWCRVSIDTRARWDMSVRPHYLTGVLQGAKNAKAAGVPEISAIELGVARGDGLVVLQQVAAEVERATGVGIQVYGFDRGAAGLPDGCGDYRDHPDLWRVGDFPMDEASLRSRLDPRRTTLILGEVIKTIPSFYSQYEPPPIGFIAFDLDFYSSTTEAMYLLRAPERRMLSRVSLYFDDIDQLENHRFAGELLAIDEFNEQSPDVKIDRCRGIANGRPFPEAWWLSRMYLAHDLAAISRTVLERTPLEKPWGVP